MAAKQIFIDLETTGLNPANDRICQIGAILPNGEEIDTLINPQVPIPQATTEIHGITNDMVKTAPLLKDVAPQLISALQEAEIFVAYNFVFDFQVLQYELLRAAQYSLDESDFTFIDPYKIFRKMFPHNLSNAYHFYTGKIMEGAHSAILDVRATREVLAKQAEIYQELFAKSPKEIETYTIGDTSMIGKWFEKIADNKFKFKQGKFRGAVVGPEHKDYLKWIYGLEDTSFSEKRYISSFLNKD